MADNFIANLIEQNEAVALDQLKQESSKKNGKSDEHSDDRRGGRSERSRDDRQSSPRYQDERAENDERRLRRSRDMSNEAHSENGSANGNGHDRRHRRSQSPTKSERRGYRERDSAPRGELRDSYRPSGGRSERRRDEDDYYRPDHDRRRRDREYEGRDRDRDRSRERSDRRGGRDGRDSRRRQSPTPPAKEDGANDRDERTVFVQQIAQSCTSSKLQKFFEQIGPVVDAQIVKDRVSGRSKG